MKTKVLIPTSDAKLNAARFEFLMQEYYPIINKTIMKRSPTDFKFIHIYIYVRTIVYAK